MEDDIEFTCPNCAAKLGLDEVGDLELVNLPPARPGERRGIGGLQTVEADPGWQERAYHFNNGEKIQNHQMEQLGQAGAPKPKRRRKKQPAAEMTPEIQEAIDKDLSAKNIKLNLNEND